MSAVEIAQHRVEGQREWRIRPGLDLTEEKAPLFFDLVCRQRRFQGDLGDQPEERLPMARERLSSHLGRLDLAAGVEQAADVLIARCDLDGRAHARGEYH